MPRPPPNAMYRFQRGLGSLKLMTRVVSSVALTSATACWTSLPRVTFGPSSRSEFSVKATSSAVNG